NAAAANFVDKFVELLFALCINEVVILENVAVVVLCGVVGDKGTDNFVGAGLIDTVKADGWILLIEGELLIFCQVVEHLTIVADIVSVDNDIGAWGFDIALKV